MLIGKSRRWLLAAALPLVLAGPPPGPGLGSAAPGSHQGLSAVRHMWVIELENQGYQQSFGTPSADPYLALTHRDGGRADGMSAMMQTGLVSGIVNIDIYDQY